MVMIRQNYRTVLRHELNLRKRFNRRYSLRAFARFLGVAPPRLSEILNGRYGLSVEGAKKITDRLGYSTTQSDFFLDLVESEHARSKKKKLSAIERIKKIKKVDFWPKIAPSLQLRKNRELILWGTGDLAMLEGFLEDVGLNPYRDPAIGGDPWIGLSIRTSFDESPTPHNEFSGIILVEDILSNTHYGLHLFHHFTDSINVIESRRKLFEKAPALTSKIHYTLSKTSALGVVDDDKGRNLIDFRIGGPGKGRESKRKVSLTRNVQLDKGQLGKTRVAGVTYFRLKKVNLKKDSIWIRADSDIGVFLKKISFRPIHWRFCRSEWDYYPIST